MRLLLLLAALAGAPAPALAQPPTPDPGSAGPRLERAAPAPGPARGFVTQRLVNDLKAGVASLGAALLLGGALLARAGRPRALGRLRDALLLGLGISAGLLWFNLLQFHFPGYAHPSEFYHYYVGSKYFRELGYTRLYECTAVADLRAGVLEPGEARRMRNLANNHLETTEAIVAEPERCTRHFTRERWRAFKADVRWIRQRVSPDRWQRTQIDHGYNATPVWGILGTLLANTGPLSAGRILALGLLDPLLLLAMWGAVAWAFGWRAMCVGLIFWGTNYAAPFGWTGGGYLRQDWLAASVIGICLLRRGRPAASGFLLAYAALLRIFPALILSGIALAAALEMWRRRRPWLSPAHRRLALGGALAAALLLPLAAATGTGVRQWLDFTENSRVHLATPLLNHVGLATLLSYDHAGRAQVTRNPALEDPVAPFKRARREAFAKRRAIFWGLVLAWVALLARAVRRTDDWAALALGIGAIPIAAELTSYYHGILLGFALLWTVRPGIGVGLCALAALGWAIAEVFQWYDEIFTWLSLATALLVFYATAAMGSRSAAAEPP